MRISDWSSDVCSSDLTAWVAPLALALQQGHLIYLLGAMFIGIAYQPFIFMLLALQIGLHTYLVGQRQAENQHGLNPWRSPSRIQKIGRASCRERGCQYVKISVVAVSLKKKIHNVTDRR